METRKIVGSPLTIMLTVVFMIVSATATLAQDPAQPGQQPEQPAGPPEQPAQQPGYQPEEGAGQPATPEIPANVRENFSQQELKSFVKANEKVGQIQQQSKQKIVNAIEEEGLSVDRFNEILQAQQAPAKTPDASPQEMSSFNKAAQVIIQENQKTEQEMTESIEQEGIDINTYQEIMLAYQYSPRVQRKVDKLLAETTEVD